MLNRIRGRRRRPLDRVRDFVGDRRAQLVAAGVALGVLVGFAGWFARRKSGTGTDDASLTEKVQNELFRAGDVPKSRIDVDVENGVVRLRGEVERHELIDELEHRTRRVEGVRDVENLVHLPTAAGAAHG
jgi:hypothetical protein